MRESPKFIAIDTETTGLEKTDELIEIAGVKFTITVTPEGMMVPLVSDRWSSLIKPNQLIPPRATEINNITNAMVENAPPVTGVLQEFAQFCGLGSILIAHNAGFDCGFIGNAIAKQQLRTISNPVIDTLRLSRKIHPEYPAHKMKSIAQQLGRAGKMGTGLRLENLHRALYDCEVLAQVFAALISEILKPNELSARSLLAALDRYHGPLLNIRPN